MTKVSTLAAIALLAALGCSRPESNASRSNGSQSKGRQPDSGVGTGPVLAGSPTASCTASPVRVSPDSIGPLALDLPIRDLKRVCAGADTTVDSFESRRPGVAFHFGSLLVLGFQHDTTYDDSAPADGWEVQGCGGVFGANVSTCATWAEVAAAFGSKGEGNTEFGPAVIRLDRLPDVSLEFDVTATQVGSLEVQPDLARMPGSARLVRVAF